MPIVSTIDKFIELSTDLLTTHPTTTTLSITYTNLAKKSKKSPTTTTTTTTSSKSTISKTIKSTHGVNFKLYEPNSGKCIKYNTKKSKELSRLLNFIGPKGVSNENSHVLGLASLMTNVKYEDNNNGNNTTNTIGGGNNSLENTPGPADTDAMEIIKGVDNETKPVSSSTGTTTTGGASSGKKKNKKKKKKN